MEISRISYDDFDLCIKKSENILFLLNVLIKNPKFNIKINLVTNLSLTSFFIKEILKIFIKMKTDTFVVNKNIFKIDILIIYLKLIRLKSYIKESFDKAKYDLEIEEVTCENAESNSGNNINTNRMTEKCKLEKSERPSNFWLFSILNYFQSFIALNPFKNEFSCKNIKDGWIDDKDHYFYIKNIDLKETFKDLIIRDFNLPTPIPLLNFTIRNLVFLQNTIMEKLIHIFSVLEDGRNRLLTEYINKNLIRKIIIDDKQQNGSQRDINLEFYYGIKNNDILVDLDLSYNCTFNDYSIIEYNTSSVYDSIKNFLCQNIIGRFTCMIDQSESEIFESVSFYLILKAYKNLFCCNFITKMDVFKK